ncbi:MAG TPA: copper resistance CopC family protein [Dehalococcoidia bacterium]|nr:copper resistance CopC family protein [Dehalococcoidia bacterium]
MKTRLLSAAALTAVALATLATTVLAHSRPIRFEPAPGAVLSTAPAEVKGWFTSDIRRDPNWTYLRVTDPQGTRVDTGETALSADRRQLTVSLRPNLGPGRYVVTWRNWDDADGEILGECYTFFIGQAAADAAVTDKFRMDAGSSCERIEASTKNGTPTPGQTTQPGTEGHEDGEEAAAGDGGEGLPAWALVLGVLAGVLVGGVGGRFIGAKS